MTDRELASLVRQGQRYFFAAQQDEDPVVEHLHLNYAFAIFEIVHHGAPRARIKSVTGVDIDSILGQVQAQQEATQRELIEGEEVGMYGYMGFGIEGEEVGMYGYMGFGQDPDDLERQYSQTTAGPIGTPIACAPRKMMGQQSPSSLLQDWLGTFTPGRSDHFEMQLMGLGAPWVRHAMPADAPGMVAAIRALARTPETPITSALPEGAKLASGSPRWGSPEGYDEAKRLESSYADMRWVATHQGPQMRLAIPALNYAHYIIRGTLPVQGAKIAPTVHSPVGNLLARIEAERVPSLGYGPAAQDPEFLALATPCHELASMIANIREYRGAVWRYIEQAPEGAQYTTGAFIWKSEADAGGMLCHPGWLHGFLTHYRLPNDVSNRMTKLHEAINLASSALRASIEKRYAGVSMAPPPPPDLPADPRSPWATTALTVAAAGVLTWLLWRRGTFRGPFLRKGRPRTLAGPKVPTLSHPKRGERPAVFRAIS